MKTAARLRLRGRRRARSWSPTAASRPSTRRFATLLDPGDEVLLPSPYWTTYPEAIRLAGGVPVDVVTDETSGYLVSVDAARGGAAPTVRRSCCLSRRPTRPVPSTRPSEVEAIGRWAAERGLWVLTDEIYEHLVYGDAPGRAPCRSLVPELADRCVVVNGVAKTYAMTGWRVGWLIGPAGRRQGGDQPAVPRHLQRGQRAQRGRPRCGLRRPVGRGEMRAAFDRRRRTIVRMLSEIPGVTCPDARRAFYVYPSVEGLLGRELRGRQPDDECAARGAGPRGGRGRGGPG